MGQPRPLSVVSCRESDAGSCHDPAVLRTPIADVGPLVPPAPFLTDVTVPVQPCATPDDVAEQRKSVHPALAEPDTRH